MKTNNSWLLIVFIITYCTSPEKNNGDKNKENEHTKKEEVKSKTPSYDYSNKPVTHSGFHDSIKIEESILPYSDKGDSLEFPPFEIRLILSEKLNLRLKELNEDLKISVMVFSPIPIKGNMAGDETGSGLLTGIEILTKNRNTIAITGLRIFKGHYSALPEKHRDLEVLLNVVHTFNNSQYNFMQADILSEPISKLAYKTHPLKLRLIDE